MDPIVRYSSKVKLYAFIIFTYCQSAHVELLRFTILCRIGAYCKMIIDTYS